jgi:hypothetical protein
MNASLRLSASLGAAAVLMTTSCTASAHGEAADTVPAGHARPGTTAGTHCAKGRFHWGDIHKRDVPAAVSDPQRVRVAAGKSARTRLELVPIRSMQATLTPSGRLTSVDPAAAVGALERMTGLSLARIGTAWTLGAGHSVVETGTTGPYSGEMVASVSVRLVEASFRFTCADAGAEPVWGTVSTWSTVPYRDFLTCGPGQDLPEDAAQTEALVCGDDA